MSSNLVGNVADSQEIHVRKCIVLWNSTEAAKMESFALQQNDGKGSLPPFDVGNNILLPGKSSKGAILQVIFYHPAISDDEVQWTVVWGYDQHLTFPTALTAPLRWGLRGVVGTEHGFS